MEDYKAQFVEIHSKLDILLELLPNWLGSKEINPPELVVVQSPQVANDAFQVFDEMPILTLVDQDEESSANNVYMPSIDELVEGFEQQSTLKLEGLEVADNMFDELPKPKSTTEDDSKLTHYVFPIFGNMVEQSGDCKVFAEMTEPVLEKDLLGIKVTEAAHNLLDERPMLSPVDSELIFVGHFEERNGNNDSTPLIVCVPRVFDPGRVTTENVCPNGSSIVEIEYMFTPPYVPSSISLKHIGATVLSNRPLPSLQLISLISWSGNESIDESCMNHLLDQKEDIAGYSLGPVLRGCEVGQPNLLTVRSIKADDQLFDNVTERFPVEQRNGSANNGNLVLPASFPTYSGFKYDALKAVLGISSSEMMFGGMRFGEMAVFMFDPGIISWHLKSCACFYSGEIPSNLAVFIWIGKVLKVIFDPGGGYWLCMGYDLVDNNGLKHSEMLNYGQLLNRVHELLNWQLMIAVCSNNVDENRVDPNFAFVNVLPISILPTAEQPIVAHYIWCLRSYFKFCCGGFLDKNSWKVITNNVATSLNVFNYKLDDGFGLNMILMFLFDPGGSSWHCSSHHSTDSSSEEQGKRVNDVGSVEVIHHLFDRGFPQQILVELNKEMYAILGKVSPLHFVAHVFVTVIYLLIEYGEISMLVFDPGDSFWFHIVCCALKTSVDKQDVVLGTGEHNVSSSCTDFRWKIFPYVASMLGLVSSVVTHLPQSIFIRTIVVRRFNAYKPVWKTSMAAILLLLDNDWFFRTMLSMDVDTMAIIGLLVNVTTVAVTVRKCSVEAPNKFVGVGMLIAYAKGDYNFQILGFSIMVKSWSDDYISVLFLDGVLWVHMIDFPSMSKLEFNPQVYDPETGAYLVGILAHSVTSHPFDHGDVIGLKSLNKDDVGLPFAITFLLEMLINDTQIVCMVTWQKKVHGQKMVVLAGATVLDNFVWDPGHIAMFFYILEDKDVFERVGKWMILIDHATGLRVTTTMFMNDHFGLEQALAVARPLFFQLGFVNTLTKVMLINSTWLHIWICHLDGRNAWVLSVSTKMESFIWNPGIFCFPCSRVTLPRSYYFVFYDHGVPNAYKKSNVATILLGQAVLHWRTLFHRSFISGFVAVHLANTMPRFAIHKSGTFVHIMVNLHQEGSASELKASLSNGISTQMIGQGQHINEGAA